MTGNVKTAPAIGVADYQWSPDSRSLLFDALGQLWIFDLATSKGRQLTDAKEPSSDPKFSPDGKYLSYVRGHNLYVAPHQLEAPRLRSPKHERPKPA